MKEHYYRFVELTSEELTDIQGGENWTKTLVDWYIGTLDFVEVLVFRRISDERNE